MLSAEIAAKEQHERFNSLFDHSMELASFAS